MIRLQQNHWKIIKGNNAPKKKKNYHPFGKNYHRWSLLPCHLSGHLSTISPQSTLNITLPFQVDGMWLRWRYLSKKRFAWLRTVMAECPQNRAPAGPSDSSVCRHDPLPCFELSLCGCGPNLGLFEVALEGGSIAGRGKGSVRTSSGIRVHGQLAICSMPVLTLLTSTHAK